MGKPWFPSLAASPRKQMKSKRKPMDGRYSKRSATNVLGYAKKRSQDLYIVKMERKIHDSIDVTSADVVMSMYFFPKYTYNLQVYMNSAFLHLGHS